MNCQPEPTSRLPRSATPPATGEPLSEADGQSILDRLPPLAEEAGDVQDFRFPV